MFSQGEDGRAGLDGERGLTVNIKTSFFMQINRAVTSELLFQVFFFFSLKKYKKNVVLGDIVEAHKLTF